MTASGLYPLFFSIQSNLTVIFRYPLIHVASSMLFESIYSDTCLPLHYFWYVDGYVSFYTLKVASLSENHRFDEKYEAV
jgi:hypothetical protein